MRMTREHFRHFIRTERSATFSSAIWYLALQLGQMNFIQYGARIIAKVQGVELGRAVTVPSKASHSRLSRCCLIDCFVSSSGASVSPRCHISTALFLKPAF